MLWGSDSEAWCDQYTIVCMLRMTGRVIFGSNATHASVTVQVID